jgi:methylenetetrahydrofolate dehydrogenase (NADP+)/methenyltetrahydrofolate cyclohydrolase
MILDGKNIKNIILDEVRDKVSKLSVKLKLVVIQIGDDDASKVYIKQKINMCNYVGYDYDIVKLDVSVGMDYVLQVIDRFNNDNNVTGILVQLPLPDLYDENIIINAISPIKDVDGITDFNLGKLFRDEDCLYPCTAYGIIELLDKYDISVEGKNVVVVGRSNLVGKPLSVMLLNRDATVCVCHSKSENLKEITETADILIVAVGEPNFITCDMVRDGVIVIDVGINKCEYGFCGDVDFASVKDKASFITPVPGGVGPMTIAMLAKNLLSVYKFQNRK